MDLTRIRKFYRKLWGRAFSASDLLEVCVSTGPSLLIQDIGDTQQICGRPDVDIDFFCGPGIGMAEAIADELDRNAFFIHGRTEIMPKRMRSKPRYPGVPGKLFTEAVQAVS